MRLHPGVKIAIGPPIADGFYYDFEFPEPISEADLEAIEDEIRREIAEGRDVDARGALPRRRDRALRGGVAAVQGRARRRRRGRDLPLHAGRRSPISAAGRTCRTPRRSRRVKLTSLAGAYWRGDEHNTQLTRIYGTAFYSQADLDAHLERLEQARARDHRQLGSAARPLPPLGPLAGLAVLAPEGHGAVERARGSPPPREPRRGYVEVKTPLLYDLETYITSGHYENYEENMFFVQPHEGEEPLALKPMNCPGHMLLFGSKLRSYRDLPIRYAESSTLHRDERGGTLHGLLRVKHITQDDAHVFVTEEQIQDEIDGMIDFVNYLYDRFGVTPRAELSTRPENRLGTDEQWDHAEAALESALARHGLEYAISPGEGTFYGPKIDLHMTDVLGRSWQMGTIQLDYQMPVQFGLTYMGAGQPRALARSSSIERCSARSSASSGSSSSTTAGDFPFWLAPVQARVLPVGDGHREAAGRSRDRLDAEGYRVEVDERDDTLGKRIRDAELEKIPFVVVYGDRESEDALAVRERGGEQSTLSLDELVARFRELAAEADPSP